MRAVALTALTVITPALVGCEGDGLTQQQQATIDRACATAEKNINAHAEEIRQAILAKKAACAKVADTLTGYKATWILLRHGDEAFKRYTQKVVEAELINEVWTTQLIGRQVAEFIIELRDVEDALARESGCPALSISTDHPRTVNGALLDTQDMELKDALQMQVFTELASLLGGEAATHLALSSGILATCSTFSWSTLGIGLGVGIVVDVIVRHIMNPAEQIANQLVSALENVAQKQSEAYRESMRLHLEERRARWTEEISHP